MALTISHHLTEEYWDSLGPKSLFLHELFYNQSQQLTQLQMANNTLKMVWRPKVPKAMSPMQSPKPHHP